MKISPSTLKRAKCLRRVVAEKAGGYQDSFGAAAAFGTKTHTVGEKWMRGEAEPNIATKEGRLFLEILPHVPSRDLDAERYLSIVCDGITFHGYIDFGGWVGDELVVGDYKTSSRPWDYGLATKELFLADEQVNIYSFANMIDYGSDTCHAYWLYADTSKMRYAYTQDAVLSYGQTEDYLADVALPKAREIIDAFAAFEPVKEAAEPIRLKMLNEIPCNPEECGYRTRNCGFTQHCELFESPELIHLPGTQDMQDELALLIAQAEGRRAAGPETLQTPDTVSKLTGKPVDPVVESATPVKPEVLPPEASAALEAAMEQRHLPPEQQDLGRKHAEKVAKEAAKTATTEAKAAKKSIDQAKADLVSACEAAGLKVAKVMVELK